MYHAEARKPAKAGLRLAFRGGIKARTQLFLNGDNDLGISVVGGERVEKYTPQMKTGKPKLSRRIFYFPVFLFSRKTFGFLALR